MRAETELTELPTIISDDTLFIQFPYRQFFSSDDSIALTDGQDITISCRVELWQRRKFWFDRLRIESNRLINLSFDRWREQFLVTVAEDQERVRNFEGHEIPPLLDSLQKGNAFRLRLTSADYSRESYLAVSFSVEYLTPEKLADLKNWLLRGTGRGPFQKEKRGNSLPDKLVGMVLNSAGFRNRSYLQSSEVFIPRSLSGNIKFSSAVN